MKKAKEKPRKKTEVNTRNDLAPILQDCLDKIMLDYYQGNRIQLFHAIIFCGRYGVTLPRWITEEVQEGFLRYTSAEGWTLDQAFKITDRKGRKKPAYQDRMKKAWEVYKEIERRAAHGESRGMVLWRSVGRKYSISGSKARDYEKAVKDELVRDASGSKKNTP